MRPTNRPIGTIQTAAIPTFQYACEEHGVFGEVHERKEDAEWDQEIHTECAHKPGTTPPVIRFFRETQKGGSYVDTRFVVLEGDGREIRSYGHHPRSTGSGFVAAPGSEHKWAFDIDHIIEMVLFHGGRVEDGGGPAYEHRNGPLIRHRWVESRFYFQRPTPEASR